MGNCRPVLPVCAVYLDEGPIFDALGDDATGVASKARGRDEHGASPDNAGSLASLGLLPPTVIRPFLHTTPTLKGRPGRGHVQACSAAIAQDEAGGRISNLPGEAVHRLGAYQCWALEVTSLTTTCAFTSK